MKARVNPVGRLDLAALNVAERLTRRHVEPHTGPLWDCAKPVVAELIKRAGLPARNVLRSGFGKALAEAIRGRL